MTKQSASPWSSLDTENDQPMKLFARIFLQVCLTVFQFSINLALVVVLAHVHLKPEVCETLAHVVAIHSSASAEFFRVAKGRMVEDERFASSTVVHQVFLRLHFWSFRWFLFLLLVDENRRKKVDLRGGFSEHGELISNRSSGYVVLHV